MPTVDATVGTSTANSYVTVAEADTYFEASFGRPLWATATPDNKAVLVINASRSLDSFMEWEGSKTNSTQSMEWPRKDTYDKAGLAYPSDAIPMPIKFAVYELCYHILANGGLNFAEQTVDRVKVGPVDVEFSKGSTDSGIPKFVEFLVSHIGTPILVGGMSAYTVKLVRS